MKIINLLTKTVMLLSIGFSSLSTAGERANCDDEWSSWKSKSCWYIGVGVLNSHVKPDASATSWKVTDDSSDGYRIYVGLNVTDHIFAEIDYSDIGEAELNHRNPLVENTEAIDYKIPTLWSGYYLRGYQENRDWDAYVKVGLSAIKNKSSSSQLPYDEQTSWQLALGAAAVYHLTPNWDVRLEFTSYDEDARTIGVSVTRNLNFL